MVLSLEDKLGQVIDGFNDLLEMKDKQFYVVFEIMFLKRKQFSRFKVIKL